MAGEALFTRAELEARVSADIVRRILDDDDVGEPSEEALTQFVQDASSTVWAYLPDTFELPADPDDASVQVVPKYLHKLALDVAQGQLYNRFPDAARTDGAAIL